MTTTFILVPLALSPPAAAAATLRWPGQLFIAGWGQGGIPSRGPPDRARLLFDRFGLAAGAAHGLPGSESGVVIGGEVAFSGHSSSRVAVLPWKVAVGRRSVVAALSMLVAEG